MKSHMWRRFLQFSVVTAIGVIAVNADAITLDWDQTAWAPSPTPAPNVTSSSFNNDPARTGNDITITATATTGAAWQASLPATPSPAPMTPVVSRAFDGGMTPGHNSLEFSVDFADKQNKVNDYITVTITFSAQYTQGVSNVSFTLFDLDYANSTSTYQDEITSMVATTTAGTTRAATITGLGTAVTLTGTGVSQVLDGNASVSDTGAGSGDGNATITFAGDNIRSVSFTYAANGAFTNPTYQHIGLSNITYSAVPEINPAWTGALSCAAAAGLMLRHRSRFRKAAHPEIG